MTVEQSPAYARFMAIKASAFEIRMFLEKHHLTPGISWLRSKKSSMAQHYASGIMNYQLTDEVIEKLEAEFGTRRK